MREPLELFRFQTAKQLVLQREEELARAGISLPGRAADELAVDPRRAVHFGGDDVQAACSADFLVELDVGSAAGHVGGDGDASRLPGLGDDFGLLLEEAGVEDLVRTRRSLSSRPSASDASTDGVPTSRAASRRVQADDLVGDGPPFELQRGEDPRRQNGANARAVRRNRASR